MVGVSLFTHRLGTVAVFATLLAAIHVTNADKGCIFDFGNVADLDLECNNQKNVWTASEDAKDSPNKKILILSPEQEGCLKTKNTITLNSTAPVTVRFFANGPSDETGKFSLRLLPKEENCPDDECFWNIARDPQFKSGEWVTAEYKFPLKSTKEYYVQLQAGKSKGKVLVDSITFPNAYGDSSRCRSVIKPADQAARANQFVIAKADEDGGGGEKKDSKNFSPSLGEFSKSLMLTSASLIILNNILN